MRFSYVMLLAQKYILLGLTIALVAGVIMILAFDRYRKKQHKEEQQMPWSEFFAAVCLVFYLVIIIGVTMGDRGRVQYSFANLKLFSSYKTAWYTMDAVGWRNLRLAIFKFVPIGFLLPFVSSVFKKWWMTYLSGFGSSLLLQMLQHALGCGVFETDELLNNTLGVMIGYGIAVFVIWTKTRLLRKRASIWQVLSFQLPLVSVLAFFGAVTWGYQLQDYGNLSCENIEKKDMSGIEVSLEQELSAKRHTASIRLLHTYSKKEAYKLAQNVFWSTGKELGEGYQFGSNSAKFYTDNHDAAIWIYYDGGRVEYEDYGQQYDANYKPTMKKTNAAKKEVKAAIEALGFYVPDEAHFQNFGNGTYQFSLSQSAQIQSEVVGTITCNYTSNDMISSMKYHMVSTKTSENCQVYSQQEAYERLAKGLFSKLILDNGEEQMIETAKELKVITVELKNVMDTKGYFQPVYHFYVSCDGQSGFVDIPARVKEK